MLCGSAVRDVEQYPAHRLTEGRAHSSSFMAFKVAFQAVIQSAMAIWAVKGKLLEWLWTAKAFYEGR